MIKAYAFMLIIGRILEENPRFIIMILLLVKIGKARIIYLIMRMDVHFKNNAICVTVNYF